MKPLTLVPAALLCLTLAGCGGAGIVSRSSNAMHDGIATQSPVAALNVTAVNVRVPADLRVSEANVYYPIADIVWRGDARGDRHAQVAAIFDAAAAQATAGPMQGRAVVADVEVLRFHCLTEKTRIMMGGVYSIRFLLTLRDAQTGQVIDGPRVVIADANAAGGARALENDANGLTQKVEVTNRIAQVLRQELNLTAPVAPQALAAAMP